MPLISGWQGEATTDEQKIRRWAAKFPDCNWGTYTNDLIVVDIDPRNGGDEKNLPTWLPWTTYRVHTGGNGYHHGYTPTEEVVSSGKLGIGIDIKGQGGFVVAPGSNHLSGGVYSWTTSTPPSSITTWPGYPPGWAGTNGSGPRPTSGWVGELLVNGSRIGHRNDDGVRLAGYFLKSMPEDVVVHVMTPWLEQSEKSPDDPFTEGDLRALVDSVSKTVRSRQRNEQTPPPPDDEFKIELQEKDVRKDMIWIATREEAKRRLAAYDFVEPGPGASMAEILSQPLPPLEWAVEDLLIQGGNALVAAQHKAGKTTLMLNLVRSMVDETLFLGQYHTKLPAGETIAYFDYEMDLRQSWYWLRDLQLQNGDKLWWQHLRSSPILLQNPQAEEWTVEWLSSHGVGVWIIDPFARAFAGDENSNSDVSAFLERIDVIKARAGVATVLLVSHFGRPSKDTTNEPHARGATRIDDWCDSRWLITKDAKEARFFRAIGRDVDVWQRPLVYTQTNRELRLGDVPGVRGKASQSAGTSNSAELVLNAIQGSVVGLTYAQLVKATGLSDTRIRHIISEELEPQGLVMAIQDGPRKVWRASEL